MRSLPAFLALMFVLAASAADIRVFIIANQAEGYGVDQCLAMGEKCGASRGISPSLVLPARRSG
jgi:hypothetical protein